MDFATKEYFRLRPIVLENLLWDLEVQGKRISVSTRLIEYEPQTRAKRSTVSRFSRAARLRMLKFVAGMDWSRIRHGVFITLTYPDACLPNTKEQRNKDRYLFHRYMENYLNKKVSLMWRIEWEMRKSGDNRYSLLPHFHLIAPGVRYIPHDEVRRWWRVITRKDGALATDIRALADERRHGIYVAKYTAKMPETSSLDNASYLNISGRHYGYVRKSEIPVHEQIKFLDLTADTVSALRAMVQSVRPMYDPRFDAGFTLLGPLAARFKAEIMRLALDDGAFPVYT